MFAVQLYAITLGSIACVAVVGVLYRRHRDVLQSSVSHQVDGDRRVVRIDPPRVPVSLRRAAWGLVFVAVVAAAVPLWTWTKTTINPLVVMSWLAGVGALAAALASYHAGLLWPAQTERLGISDGTVWWDRVDRHAQPGPSPTSTAVRTPLSGAVLDLEGGVALVRSRDGLGIVFGPLPEGARRVLLEGWTR